MSSGGGVHVLDIFALRDSVISEYKQFATSFTTIHAPDIRSQVEAIYAEERYWPEPLIQINPSYKRSTDIQNLVDGGALDPVCADIFQVKGTPLTLYKHQEQAVALAEAGESYVVTTGTGSGKSLCFFIPIVHRVLAEKRRSGRARTRAIIIYPMNALANSQLEELWKFVGNVAGAPPITFARYTGQEDAEERKRIADNPPDILLTNFMMLELLMTRQEEVDRRVIDNWEGRCPLSGLAVVELLRASHIKPWADCETDAERLDVFNGLLLAPHLDAAFDRGFLTLDDEGRVVLAFALNASARASLGVDAPLQAANLTDAHRAYLTWHRERVFRGTGGAQ